MRPKFNSYAEEQRKVAHLARLQQSAKRIRYMLTPVTSIDRYVKAYQNAEKELTNDQVAS